MADSHLELPRDERSTTEIMEKDVLPFEELISLNMLHGIMPAHVVYADQDMQPAGFSKIWLQQILRARLGFEGAIFSDDLNMAAAGMAGSFTERTKSAMEAGCDMVLVCNNRPGAIEVLDNFHWEVSECSSQRLLKMKGNPKQTREQLQLDNRWKAASDAAAELLKQMA